MSATKSTSNVSSIFPISKALKRTTKHSKASVSHSRKINRFSSDSYLQTLIMRLIKHQLSLLTHEPLSEIEKKVSIKERV